ncbi:hypothetical protein ABT369_17610 [Dactylosporangium sp. NPDC000244]|uniref:hypothetical protein n=1 Tax=Dactylosporangium sp. NPDC000244 TaxID=3154365 RepID=UPI0033252FF7
MRARAAVAGLALAVCALLLGLSLAHHAVPGDTFQVQRAAPAHAMLAADVRDAVSATPVAAEGEAQPRFTGGPAEQSTTKPSIGWSGEPAGCRGPPSS